MVKFLDVKYSESTSLYNITAEYTEALPAKGDCIFMQAFVFKWKISIFIGQLNLAELDLEAITGLPATGMLYFSAPQK